MITVQELADVLSRTLVNVTPEQVANAVRNVTGRIDKPAPAITDEISDDDAERVRAKMTEVMNRVLDREMQGPQRYSAALDNDVQDWMDEEAGLG